MSHGVSTYRSIASALVATLVLLLGAGAPTLVHLCTMGAAPTLAEVSSEAPPCHDDMAPGERAMGEMAMGEMAMGDEAPAEDSPAPCGPVAQVCCLSIAAVPADQAVVAEVSPSVAPAFALVAALAPQTVTPAWTPAPRDTGPPPAVRPHLALSVLLI